MSPPLVIIESPYAGDVQRNVIYARKCLLDSLRRGEYPMASHLLYTQVLDDLVADDRSLGIAAGLAWAAKADLTAAYMDMGESSGMRFGILAAKAAGRPFVLRWLNGRADET